MNCAVSCCFKLFIETRRFSEHINEHHDSDHDPKSTYTIKNTLKLMRCAQVALRVGFWKRGYKNESHVCKMYIYVLCQQLSWPQALLFCRRRKKQLATIMDEDEHQSVRDEVNRITEMWGKTSTLTQFSPSLASGYVQDEIIILVPT